MDDSGFDIVTLAVEIMATLLVIGFIGLAISLSTSMQKSYQREADIQVMMQEMATYSKYDGNLVSGSDVIEAIYLYTSEDFTVTCHGTTYGGTASLPTGGTLGITPTTSYMSSLVISPNNGQVTGIAFN